MFLSLKETFCPKFWAATIQNLETLFVVCDRTKKRLSQIKIRKILMKALTKYTKLQQAE
jgi:hypothetical protein